MSSGISSELDWLEEKLSKRYKIKTQGLRDAEGQREVRILTKIVRITPQGCEMEADSRHAEVITEQMSEYDSSKGHRAVMTPGIDVDDDIPDINIELASKQARVFRSIAARCLYLSLDRPDIQDAAKDICRQMAAPTTGSWKKLQRVSRYIASNPRMVRT